VRSSSSSSSFFKSVDRDGDGVLRAAEVGEFLKNEIGGTAFDTSSEIESEVESVMLSLDRNQDEGLDASDVFAYWNHLESLLTAEEVAEWVVHAVQLPEYVGRIFKQHGVTGYDFPELVDNNGEPLTTDLGIQKVSHRKKIMRHIHARMLGIGTVPDAPANLKYKVESCSTLSFFWDKSEARGFPVHSYRVQRRAVKLHNDFPAPENELNGKNSEDSNSNYCIDQPSDVLVPYGSCQEQTSQPKQASTSASKWYTVYTGGDTDFHDSSLEPGYTYVYRIQAWNSVGRSGWVTLDTTAQLKRNKCLQPPTRKRSHTGASSSLFDQTSYSINTDKFWNNKVGFYVLSALVSNFIRGILSFIAFVVAMLKWRRAAARSTATSFTLPFPKVWHRINFFSQKLIGTIIIPDDMLGGSTDQLEYDIAVNATKLDGYNRDITFNEGDKPCHRRMKLEKKNNLPNVIVIDDSKRSIDSEGSFPSNDTCLPLEPKVESKLRPIPKFNRCFTGDSSTHSVPITRSEMKRTNNESEMKSRHSYDSVSPCGSLDEASCDGNESENEVDNHKVCNTCRKKYKIGKRWKHHCARCLSTFCHKHGRTTHNNWTSCKVPGSCVCNKCLRSDSRRSSY